MKRKGAWWIGLCVAIAMACRSVAAEKPWRVSEQPELKEALQRAPAVQTEPLGEPARGVNVWERWFVPNPDGHSWDLLQIYFKNDSCRTDAPLRGRG